MHDEDAAADAAIGTPPGEAVPTAAIGTPPAEAVPTAAIGTPPAEPVPTAAIGTPPGEAVPSAALPEPDPLAPEGVLPPPAIEAGDGASSARRRSRWVWPVVAAVLAVALVVAVVLYLGERSDRQDLEAQLATVEDELTTVEDELARTEAELGATAAAAESAEGRVAELERELTDATGAVGSTEARVAELEGELADATAEIEELESREAAHASKAAEALGFLLTDGRIDEDAAACMAEQLVDALGASALADVIRVGSRGGADELGEMGLAMLNAGEACGVDPAAFEDAMSYGDDPELDALHDACAGGDGAACDELFAMSPVGSDYEAFAHTCGERFTVEESPNFCEGNLPPD